MQFISFAIGISSEMPINYQPSFQFLSVLSLNISHTHLFFSVHTAGVEDGRICILEKSLPYGEWIHKMSL